MISVKKYFSVISSAVVFGFGLLLYYSGEMSDHAAWSLIVSGVNHSAWELFKPFALSYISFIIIELSYLRPSLLRFVCSKITGLHMLCAFTLAAGCICRLLPDEIFFAAMPTAAGAGVLISELSSYCLYKKGIRTELFAVPLLLSLAAMIFLLIILTFYPPHFIIFHDPISNLYGRMMDSMEQMP